MQTVDLTEEQRKAHDAVIDFVKAAKDKEDPGYITVGGYAGTGKTTTAGAIRSTLRQEFKENFRIAMAAYTGKAASVLASKMPDMGPDDSCGTIHSLIYIPIMQGKMVIGWRRKDAVEAEAIFIDEGSMVSEDIFNDLRKYKKPIIVFGDHGQLPPVSGNFSLMMKPDFRLEKIHRQAETSPIIQLSIRARMEGRIPFGTFGEGVAKVPFDNLADAILQNHGLDRLYLCGFNGTRVFLNKLLRGALKIRSEKPIKGERLICLKNNRKEGIYNGMTGELQEIKKTDDKTLTVTIKMDGQALEFEGVISRFQFGQKQTPQNWNVSKLGNLFDFAYAMTVHKSQGSEAKDVVFVEERLPDSDDSYHARFIYTAVTRAKERLLILGRRK